MSTSTKTDNANPAAKHALRRHFLRKYHTAENPIRVLDCCQGSGKIWRKLANEFPIRSWGLDVKPRPGRLKIDSARVLAAGGYAETVIDIDTYGSPWKHWAALLDTCDHPVTVFLTIGLVKIGGGNFDHSLLPVLGLNFQRLDLPNSLGAKLSDLALAASLAPHASPFKIVDALESPNPGGSARYIGLRLEMSAKTPSAAVEKENVPRKARLLNRIQQTNCVALSG